MSEVIARARESFKKTKESWADIYKLAREDIKFLSGKPGVQWDAKHYHDRISTGRPAITIDQLTQFIHQVGNDIRQNTPSINIFPSDREASEEVAETLKGLIKEIEYTSNADEVYDTAAMNAIRCGIGFIRIDHDYVDDKGFEQRLKIRRVPDPMKVYIDHNSIECDGRDAECGYILEKITVAEFKRRYPKKEVSCFESDEPDASLTDDDSVTVCEYYEIEKTPKIITSEDGQLSREIYEKTVRHYVLSGKEILEESTFPGQYIPIVPVYGEELWMDGKRQLFSLIRKSKGAQQMFNLWKSLETELLMKAPQARTMAAVGQIEDFAEDWLNPEKAAVLRYSATDADGNLIGAPQRLEPPSIPSGVVNASRGAVEDIKSTMGIYASALGAPSNETSGIAIRQRQSESDVATFHFADNLVRSITQVGRILVGAIPTFYNTPRILKIIGQMEDFKDVGVNGELVENQPQTIDLTQGSYVVRVSTGASYSTQRQEKAELLQTLFAGNPGLFDRYGDIFFKNLDYAGADELAERTKKFMDPAIIGDDQDPQMLAFQQKMQEMAGVIQTLQAELQNKQADLQLKQQSEMNDAEEAQAKIQIEALKLEIEKQKSDAELALQKYELDLKAQELVLKEAELQAKALQGSAPAAVAQYEEGGL